MAYKITKSMGIIKAMSKPNIENLISGYKEQASKLKNNNDYQNLVKYGQDPKTLIVSCCDSE